MSIYTSGMDGSCAQDSAESIGLRLLARQLADGTYNRHAKLAFPAPAAFQKELAQWLRAVSERPQSRLTREQWWIGLSTLWVLSSSPQSQKPLK